MRHPRLMAGRRWGRAIVLCVIALGTAPRIASPAPEDPSLLERRVKAAFLFRFAGYVEWPATAFPTADTPLTIGVLGDDRIERELRHMVEGKHFGHRPVTVVRLVPFESAAGVHVLFVGHSEAPRFAELIRAAAPVHTLTVTESDDGLAQGSMINFVLSEGRVRFQVSLRAVSRHGLALHSGLLAVAHSVFRGTP